MPPKKRGKRRNKGGRLPAVISLGLSALACILAVIILVNSQHDNPTIPGNAPDESRVPSSGRAENPATNTSSMVPESSVSRTSSGSNASSGSRASSAPVFSEPSRDFFQGHAHYTAQQLQNLYAFIAEHEGGTADDAELLAKYDCNQCRGFVVKILDECYGIKDNTCFDNSKYRITSPHYKQLDQIVYKSAKISKDRFKEMFALSGVGDFVQFKTKLQWHSAVVLNVTADGVEFFDANYNPKNDILHDGSPKKYNFIQRHTLLWEDFERDFNSSGSGITLYQMVS